MNQPRLTRPLLHRVLCTCVGQEIPPPDTPMPLAGVLPRRGGPLGLPPMPVRTIDLKGGDR